MSDKNTWTSTESKLWKKSWQEPSFMMITETQFQWQRRRQYILCLCNKKEYLLKMEIFSTISSLLYKDWVFLTFFYYILKAHQTVYMQTLARWILNISFKRKIDLKLHMQFLYYKEGIWLIILLLTWHLATAIWSRKGQAEHHSAPDVDNSWIAIRENVWQYPVTTRCYSS